MYEIILNSMTKESLKKILKITDTKEIKLNQDSDSMASAIEAKMDEDQEFKSQFITYFKDLEKGGRKDFWFGTLSEDLLPAQIKTMKENIKKIPPESEDLYIPRKENDPRYFVLQSASKDIIECKIIRKKIESEKDESKTTTDGDYIYVAYKQKEIRHVSYIKLDLTKNKVLIGVDVWKQLISKKEKLEEIKKDVDYILFPGFFDMLQFKDLKTKANKVFDLENVITKELKEKIQGKHQSAGFSIDTEKANMIRKELKQGSLRLETLKTDCYADDVADNEVYKAAKGKSINLLIKAGKGLYFYLSDLTGEFEYFGFQIYAPEARIKILNDHIMPEDLQDVFSKIN